MTPSIILVGADAGGVGKSTAARALIDYYRAKGAPVRAIDTEVDAGGVLRRFVPNAELVDIATVPGQVRMFDIASDGMVVVDVRAGLLSTVLRALAETGLMTEARAGTLKLVVLHVIAATVTSTREISDLVEKVRGARYIIVRNHRHADAIFDKIGDGLAEAVIDIPNLNETATAAIDTADASFLDFASRKPDGHGDVPHRVLSGYTRAWLDRVFAEYERAGLGQVTVPGARPRTIPITGGEQ